MKIDVTRQQLFALQAQIRLQPISTAIATQLSDRKTDVS